MQPKISLSFSNDLFDGINAILALPDRDPMVMINGKNLKDVRHNLEKYLIQETVLQLHKFVAVEKRRLGLLLTDNSDRARKLSSLVHIANNIKKATYQTYLLNLPHAIRISKECIPGPQSRFYNTQTLKVVLFEGIHAFDMDKAFKQMVPTGPPMDDL